MGFKIRKKLRVMVLVDQDLIPPKSLEGLTEEQIAPFRMEQNVISALEGMGHVVQVVGVIDDLRVVRRAIEEHRPHIVFNLLVEFRGFTLFEPHVVSYLELLKQPYTGCNPRGLMLADDKALTKKILSFHRIRVPLFAVFHPKAKVRKPERVHFPLMVKSLIEEGSTGISQASIVNDDPALADRVEFIHRHTGMPAIAEEYIEGREIYSAVIGNQRLQTFAPWELIIQNLPAGASYIATSRLKWNRAYQEKVGLITKAADLDPEIVRQMDHLSKRIYRALNLSGYARMDFRLTADNRLYLLEANPNPDISEKEDFAEAAKHDGISYEAILQKIMTLGLRYKPAIYHPSS